MIKLAFNKENPNLVFEIDSIDRVAVGEAGIEEKYLGTLIDTSTVPDTHKENYRVQVAGFEMKWTEVPIDLGSTGDINNQDKTVTPTTSQQTVKPDSGYTGLNSVKVKAAPLEIAEVDPSTTRQTVLPSSGKIGLSRVQVNEVTSDIDANITAGNIKKDVTILGVTGSYEGSSSGGDLKTVYPDYLKNGRSCYVLRASGGPTSNASTISTFLSAQPTGGIVIFWTDSQYAAANGPYYWIQKDQNTTNGYNLCDLSTGEVVTRLVYDSGAFIENSVN